MRASEMVKLLGSIATVELSLDYGEVLDADDETVAAVRKLYGDRLARVDKRFAECRTQHARAERERTAQAEYAVQLEDKIRELGGTLA